MVVAIKCLKRHIDSKTRHGKFSGKALQIALEKLEENPPHFRILDLGTGTGAIALALASELAPICQKRHIPLEIIGVDLMPDVVALAQSNAERNQLNVEFCRAVGLII